MTNSNPPNHPHDTKLAGAVDGILAQYFTWKGEAIHEVNQTQNYQRMKQAILALITSARSEATHQFILDMPDGVYNKKGRNLVMIDINTIPSRSDWVKEVVGRLVKRDERLNKTSGGQHSPPQLIDIEARGYNKAIDEVTKLLKGGSDE